jgi:putative transcriptional regulator
MTIQHHPSDEVLMQYAGGMMDAGLAVVVAIHIAQCPVCRARVLEFEAIGGELLLDLPPTLMAPDALARALSQIEAGEPRVSAPVPRQKPRIFPEGIAFPAALEDCEIGNWRFLAPGLRGSRVRIPGAPKANVMMFWGQPSRKLPSHGHTGLELTQVLAGSFTNPHGRFCPGDLGEADFDVNHQPVIDADGECICIVATEGRTRLHGIVARLVQPFIGF